MFKINWLKATLISLLMVYSVGTVGAAEMTKEYAQMKMHHLHMMMNKGILLATEGSNLMMLSKMKKLPSIDNMAEHHGREMVKESKPLIQRTMSGPTIMELHNKKFINDPLMRYTKKLAEAMIESIERLDEISMEDMSSQYVIKLSHLHTLLNHALEMAAEGSNLSILGHMGKTGETMDTHSINQGNKMMVNAKLLLSTVVEGKAMKEVYESDSSPEAVDMMKKFHHFADAAMKVVDMLIDMPH
jgi:hypothetical protein